MYQGKYVFAQLIEFIPIYKFNVCVNKYKGNNRVRDFTCWDQLLAMMFGQITFRESLRSIVVCLNAQKDKLYHLGFRKNVMKTTLLRANEKRNWKIYQNFAQVLIKEARELYVGDNEFISEIDGTVYALDASTIDLCLNVFKWAKFRKKKGAIKLHTVIDLQGNIPTFIHITDGKVHDVNVLDIMEIEAKAYYIVDKGYLDFERLYKIHKASAFFIIRAKRNTQWKRVYSNKVDQSTGIRCDQTIKLTGLKPSKKYPEKLRRIKYYDENQKKYYVFLTNNFELEAKMIADLYKQRWQIELFFKWIKQHLKVKVFWGESENAVKTQVWIAICTYVLVAIMKKKLQLKQSLYEILQILSVSAFDKTQLISLFTDDELQIQVDDFQIPLF